MAKFDIAYNSYVKPWEGFYGWNPADSGGETYGGISRVNNPTWLGWVIIDFEKHKKNVDKLPNNSKVVGIDGYVQDFYRDLWTKDRMDTVKNQDVANIVYDLRVNSGPGNVEKIVGPIVGAKKFTTIVDLLSTGDPLKLHDQIKAARVKFYNDIVAAKPSQSVFLKGWLNRINSFPDLSTGVKIGGSLLLVLIVAGVILMSLK